MFYAINKEFDIAKVKSLGKVYECYDEYYGYYDLYVTDKIYIAHVLTKEEI